MENEDQPLTPDNYWDRMIDNDCQDWDEVYEQQLEIADKYKYYHIPE